MRKLTSGGGWQAIRYSLKMGREVGFLPLWRAMASRNACKTCALGMGGQQGGMRNETGHFPEVCKKSFQAMAADMRGRIEPRFFETYSIAQLKTLTPRELEMSGRLATPLFAAPGDTHYRPIRYQEAIQIASDALKGSAPERVFFYCSGRSSNEAGFVLQLLARSFGTNHVNNCSYYCHQASGVGLSGAIGTGTATISLDDLEHSDLVFLIGANPASNHPRLMTSLMRLRNRGGHVVVVNPVRELGLERFRVPSSAMSMLRGTDIASQYVQVRVGGDIAFLAGVAKALLYHGNLDSKFIEDSTEGFHDLKTYLEQLTWPEIELQSGISEEQIERVAELYGASKGAVFAWTMGITQHEHGVENVQWIVNLALMRGMLGRPGAGVMPIRGHSNVQGLGSVGVTPYMTQSALEGLEKLGIPVPAFKGFDTLAALEAADRNEVQFALSLGGNLFGASPDLNFCEAAFSKIETVVYLSTTLNTGHAHGLGKNTLIIPVLARDEEKQATTQESMFNFVRLSEGGVQRNQDLWSEVDVLTSMAHCVLGEEGPIDWTNLTNHDAIRSLIAKLVPSFKDIESIGSTKKEFEVSGRVLHQPNFSTSTGKAVFNSHPIPQAPSLGPNELRLMTVRSEGQFNTVVYEEQDLYRGQERRDVVLINPKDMDRLGLKENELVTIKNETGKLAVLARPFDIAEGAALMYYPEANVLAPRKTDPKSKTPAFKSVVVSIEPIL